MTPAEVIAMRDKLSAVIEESKLATWPVDIADMLIGSGWVTNEPGRECVRLQARRGE